MKTGTGLMGAEGAVGLALLALTGLAACNGPPGSGASSSLSVRGPVPVATTPAVRGDIAIRIPALGNVTPSVSITVKAQVSGQLLSIAFTEGQTVHEGDLLAQIDPRSYQVALDLAQANLKRDRALLATEATQMPPAATPANSATNSMASTASTQCAGKPALAAAPAAAQATVQADLAAVEAVRLSLERTRIVAPAGGRLGLRQVDPGNYVTPGDAHGIVVINQLQPVTVLFTLPEDDISPISRRLDQGAVLPVTLFDRGNSTPLAHGRLTSIDNQIDTNTGTFKLRAVFDNTDGALFPNQLVHLQLLVETLHD